MCVSGQRVFPLLGVLGVLPAGAVTLDISLAALAEGDRLSDLERELSAARVACCNWIGAVRKELAAVGRLGAGIRKRNRERGPEAHLARLAVEHVTERPGFAAGRR